MKRWLVRLALAAAVVAAVLAAMRPNPSLLERSSRVIGSLSSPSEPYVWLSDHELIRFPVDTKQDGQGNSMTIMRAEQLDTKTGLRTPLTDLSRRLRAQRDYASLFRLSPDGKWLVYAANNSDDDYPRSHFYVSEVGGPREREWPLEDAASNGMPSMPPGAVWLPDSRRWLELAPDETGLLGVRMHSLDVDSPKALPVTAPARLRSLLGVTPDYRLIATDFYVSPGSAARSVDLYEVGLYPNPTPPRRHTLRAPPNAQILDIALSPRGDRLAWAFYFSRVPTGMQWLARFIPSLRKRLRPRVGAGLWVSRLDGSEMREIGYQEIDPNVPAPLRLAPAEIHWTPDGRRLSFVYKNALYTVPVNQ